MTKGIRAFVGGAMENVALADAELVNVVVA